MIAKQLVVTRISADELHAEENEKTWDLVEQLGDSTESLDAGP